MKCYTDKQIDSILGELIELEKGEDGQRLVLERVRRIKDTLLQGEIVYLEVSKK